MTGPQTPQHGRLEDEGRDGGTDDDRVEEAAGVVGEAVARRNEHPEPYDEEEASPT
ncbi:hypothetical protein EV188_104414 [Actinomycetospora succinea]|uniref:Uncharacterized protein n=1 Tax=Actinomycetospora succinea TaxID=663603 RepID=A0A4R6V9U5_9PSEU|nr:hypothetical protein [Actinomycetospora succinea]TDQ58667.1 hypothetical protein EV188_104414 [Actinomycetospora succinea]